MISLIIKGNRVQAQRHARARGIVSYRFVRCVGERETVAMAHPADMQNIISWYGENNHAPFPEGTLLLYTDLNDGYSEDD